MSDESDQRDERDESDALHARARAFVAGDASTDDFDGLALDIARFQAKHVPAMKRLVEARGVALDAATRADAIPAVPTDAFRLTRVAAHGPELDARVFATSGTTAEARGEHAMRTTVTYAAGALAWGTRRLLRGAERGHAIALLPSAEIAPRSSLSFMVDRFADWMGGPTTWALERDALDLDAILAACASARESGRPAIVFGTSFSFVHLLDHPAVHPLALPAGSRVMTTGGFKGRTREVDADALAEAIARAFAVARADVVSEYGMTELSSQLYDRGDGVHRPPPWLRVTAVDPVTLAPRAAGEEGLARFVDLGNVDSAVAVQTADLVRVAPDGGVTLFGRAPGSTPRGCSLAIDAILSGDAGR